MAAEIRLQVQGLAEMRRALLGLAPKLRKRALRNALAAGARAYRDEAKRLAPVLKLSTYAGASAARRGVRKAGTLRNAIRVRTSKVSTRRGDVGVFVNVKPLKGGSAKNPNDPYYWRWQEFGWNPASGKTTKASRRALNQRFKSVRAAGATSKPGVGFLRGAAGSKGAEALRRIEQSLGPQIKRLNVKGAVL